MWSSMVVLALPIALDPVRLGLNLLLISRSRPAQNLLVYWLGCAITSVLLLLIPILTLRFTPMFSSLVHDLASPATTASTTVRLLEVVAGVVVVVVAAALAVHFWVRQRAQAPTQGANPSSVAVDADPPNPMSRLAGKGGSRSALRRLLGRGNTAWESGSLWVALAIGLWAAPNPAFIVFGLATIATSGAAIGTQIGAAIVFTAEALAVVEIVLVSNLVAPIKTEAFLRRVHDWARAYRRQILVAMLTFVGLALAAQGMGII
jgi:hypothetical protein